MNCQSVAIKGLQMDCEPNVGGIKRVWLAIYEDGIFTVSANTKGDDEVSAIKSGTTWYEYEFRKGAGSFNSTLNIDETNGVNYVQTELALQFSRMESQKRTAIAALAVAEVAAIVLDANGKYWALAVDEPITSTAGTAETGAARGDTNQYTITLSTYSRTYPYEIPKSVVDAALA